MHFVIFPTRTAATWCKELIKKECVRKCSWSILGLYFSFSLKELIERTESFSNGLCPGLEPSASLMHKTARSFIVMSSSSDYSNLCSATGTTLNSLTSDVLGDRITQ
jgi:hypothetical protein